MALADTEMPRSRSIFIQSDRVRRCSPRARTAPAARIAPAVKSRFSVKVVLPASGWLMMAKVRRRAASAAEKGGMGGRERMGGAHANPPAAFASSLGRRIVGLLHPTQPKGRWRRLGQHGRVAEWGIHRIEL